MPLTPGTRIGVYEITAQIGVGGMGEVYRATDSNLKRSVAIKVLPASVAADAERLARFQREAEVLAALNHPNIATIHGLERTGDMTALVMELVEGDDLSERIAAAHRLSPSAHGLPLDEALPIAKQIAEALEAAHEQGIIHRDLKPANIKVRADGTVKVLDFGLAKALDGPGGSGGSGRPGGAAGVYRPDSPDRPDRPDFSASPTLTSPAMTQAGMILGTAAYMSPEQAKGRPVDRRADIWAFGAVLYEMLTGRRAFGGEDVSDTLANVLKTDPAWERLPADVPARIRQVLRSCLQRDAKQRLGDMQSVRLALDGAFETVAPQTTAATSSAAGGRLVWMALAIVAVAGMAAMAVPALRYLRETPPPAPHVTHTAITLTPDLPLSPTPVALSPDGQTLAMTAGNQIVLRRLDSTKLTTLPGTEGGSTPFFSPDGNWIGFVAAGELRRIRVDGTSRQTIGRLSSALQGPPDWAVDDLIYFGLTGTGLFRVPASGGAPTPSTQPHREAGEITHRSPQVLDDGHTVLFTIDRSDGAVPALLSVPSGEWRVIPGIRSDFARYVPSGHLLYRQGESVFAVPMSLASGTTIGTPEPLFGGVFADLYSSLAMSADGALAYLPDSIATSNQARIALVSRSGTVTSVVDDNVTPLVSANAGLRFSPDAGSIVAVLLAGGSDIWTYDLRRGARIKLTDRGPINTTPTWSPDGTQVAFNSTREPAGIYVQSVDAAGSAKLVLRRGAAVQAPGAWSRDGRTLVFAESNPRTGLDLWTLTLDGKATPLLVTPARERGPRLSPDGRWLTYQSDTAGRDDVYVASFPTLGSTQLVSIDGGTSPRWAGEREIVYRRGRQVVSVTVTPGETLTLGRPTVLFEVDDVSDQYDVSPDGTTFVMLLRDAAGAGTAPGQVNLVLNLFEQLKRLVPTK